MKGKMLRVIQGLPYNATIEDGVERLYLSTKLSGGLPKLMPDKGSLKRKPVDEGQSG